MNYKRALGISVLVYFGSMVVVMITCAILGIKPDLAAPIPMEMWLITAAVTVVLSACGAFWYFQGKGLKPNAKSGAQFGLAVLAIGLILDLIFFWSLSFEGHDPLTVMSFYYSNLMFWLIIILIIVSTSGVGWWLQQKKKS